MITKIKIGGTDYLLRSSVNFYEIYNAIALEDISHIRNDAEMGNLPLHKLVNVFKAGVLCNDETFDQRNFNEIDIKEWSDEKVITDITKFTLKTLGLSEDQIEDLFNSSLTKSKGEGDKSTEK